MESWNRALKALQLKCLPKSDLVLKRPCLHGLEAKRVFWYHSTYLSHFRWWFQCWCYKSYIWSDFIDFWRDDISVRWGLFPEGMGLLFPSIANVIALNTALEWMARVYVCVHCREGVCRIGQNAFGSLEYFSKISYLKLNPTYLN